MLVTLATTGEIPIAVSTGKVTNVPPPAIAFIIPAAIAAEKAKKKSEIYIILKLRFKDKA